MIVLQDNIDTRPVKVDWYWKQTKPEKDDGTLVEVNPYFIITESQYTWDTSGW